MTSTGRMITLLGLTLVPLLPSMADDPALLGHWPFDEGYGIFSADISPNGNDAMLHRASWASGGFGKAIKLDGEDSFVSLPPLPELNGSDEITLSLWVLWEGSGRYPNILSAGWNPGGLMIFVADNRCSFRMGRPGHRAGVPGEQWQEVEVVLLNDLPKDRWVHLAVSFRRPDIRTFVNGKLVSSAKWDYGVATNGDILLGRWTGTKTHQGLVDDLRIYKRALDDEEIADLADWSSHAQISYAISEKNTPVVEIARWETSTAIFVVGEDAQLHSCRLKATADRPERELLSAPAPIGALTLQNGQTRFGRKASLDDAGRLLISYGRHNGHSRFVPRLEKDYLVLTLDDITVPEVKSVSYGRISTVMDQYVGGMAGLISDDDAGLCLRSLSLGVDTSFGAKPPQAQAWTTAEHGLGGHGVALLAAPRTLLRPMLQGLAEREAVPRSAHGGPASAASPATRGSYLFADLAASQTDAWIDLARRGGFMFIHLHGWWRTLGHYDINPGYFPKGLDDMKASVAKIHAAGLKAGIHTLTACIDPRDPWVSPEPSPDLIASARYTLAKPFAATDTSLFVNEKPVPGHELVWTYASNGNAIRLGSEIIRYSAISHDAPYAFLDCERGAFGTRVADHAAGSNADYLQQRYIAFYPEPDSRLADDLADAIAKVFNACNLDMLYFDGSEGMRSRYGIDTMRWKIFQRLHNGAVTEASCHGHNNWWFHSRLGAWDHPVWAMKPFHDEHIRIASRYRQAELMEPQLGWWAPRGASSMARGHFTDEMEYFAAKNLAIDGPMSIQGVNVSRRPPNGRQEDMFTLLGWYERLRLARYFDAETIARVAEPGRDVRLRQNPAGLWQFTPVATNAKRLTQLDATGAPVRVSNPHAEQPLRCRIEALYSLAPVADKLAAVLIDFSDDGANMLSCATGVKLSVAAVTDDTRGAARNLRLQATNAGTQSRGAWAMLGRIYGHPYLSMGPGQGMGLWVKGDGSGALLNIQLRTPAVYHGAISDHYVDLDFSGWRFVELLLRERDSARLTDYEWPYSARGGSHAVYRNPIRTSALSEINVLINEIPAGGAVAVTLSPILSLPQRKNQLQQLRLDLNGQQLTLPWTLLSGDYIEIEGPDGMALFNERGELQDRQQLATPTLRNGENILTLTTLGLDGLSARAELTTFALGEPFGNPAESIDWSCLDREYELPVIVGSHAGANTTWAIRSRPGPIRPRLELDIEAQSVGNNQDNYDAAAAILLDPCADPAEYSPSERNDYAKFAFDTENQGTAKPGVTFALAKAAGPHAADGALQFNAVSSRQDNSGWAAVGRRFAAPQDISAACNLSFWLYGDGGNHTFKVQLRDVKGVWHDMVTNVDFTGWRLCTFPLDDVKLNLAAVEYILFFYNGLAGGQQAACVVDDVKAVTDAYQLDTPILTLGKQQFTFPVQIATGQRLRCQDGTRWQLLGANGRELAAGILPEALPALPPGESTLNLKFANTGNKDFQVLVRAIKLY